MTQREYCSEQEGVVGAPELDVVSPLSISRVLVTGAEGVVGGVVRRFLADVYDLTFLTRHPVSFDSHVADITDLESIRPAFEGVEAVVHLAASSSVDSPWESVLADNIIGCYNVFEAARSAGVRRVVLASSNHVVGMFEAEGAPGIYELEDPRQLDTTHVIRPDSLYGVSKVFGEALGRLYAERFGMGVVCLRIGSVREDDDPSAVTAGRPFGPLPVLTKAESRKRMRAVWLSHRDCAQLIRTALDADTHWAVVYGVSDNPRLLWTLQDARSLLGFEPEDSAPR